VIQYLEELSLLFREIPQCIIVFIKKNAIRDKIILCLLPSLSPNIRGIHDVWKEEGR
jgi:hypothetical protein